VLRFVVDEENSDHPDFTRRMYMERYQNVAQYLVAYRLNGILTNFQKCKINSTIHCLCYSHKQVQTVLKHVAVDIWIANINRLVAVI
jgi:hypothetical protein